jgi:hypothetical protein
LACSRNNKPKPLSKNAIFLMNASSNWHKFLNMLARALGKPYQKELGLFEE